MNWLGAVLFVVFAWFAAGSIGAIINAKSVKEKMELKNRLANIRRWLWKNGFGVKDFNFENPDTHRSTILSYESFEANKRIATVIILIIYGFVGLKVALDGRRELRELKPLAASADNLEKKMKTFEQMSAPA